MPQAFVCKRRALPDQMEFRETWAAEDLASAFEFLETSVAATAAM